MTQTIKNSDKLCFQSLMKAQQSHSWDLCFKCGWERWPHCREGEGATAVHPTVDMKSRSKTHPTTEASEGHVPTARRA